MTDQSNDLSHITPKGSVSQRYESQHKVLREMIAEVRGTLESQSDSLDILGSQLSVLAQKLQEHFLEEEEGGFFDHIRKRAPQLSTNSTQLEKEHVDLLGQIRDLIAKAATCEGSEPWWQGLKTDFHDFSKLLTQHESLENQLLQRAYSEDIGFHD
ncbi:MAG: hemerythrin domain-containing protein [Pirellulales bacterium]